MNKVEDFINKFKLVGYKDELEYVFCFGNCYYFALILEHVFNGRIYYNPILNHFALKYKNNLYDIRGKIEFSKDWVSWVYYQKLEPLDAARIKKYCIRKEFKI